MYGTPLLRDQAQFGLDPALLRLTHPGYGTSSMGPEERAKSAIYDCVASASVAWLCAMCCRMRWSAVMYIVMSAGLTLCVPVLGLLALCLAVKLRLALQRHGDQRRLRSHEKTVFWTVFAACVCFSNNYTVPQPWGEGGSVAEWLACWTQAQ